MKLPLFWVASWPPSIKRYDRFYKFAGGAFLRAPIKCKEVWKGTSVSYICVCFLLSVPQGRSDPESCELWPDLQQSDALMSGPANSTSGHLPMHVYSQTTWYTATKHPEKLTLILHFLHLHRFHGIYLDSLPCLHRNEGKILSRNYRIIARLHF